MLVKAYGLDPVTTIWTLWNNYLYIPVGSLLISCMSWKPALIPSVGSLFASVDSLTFLMDDMSFIESSLPPATLVTLLTIVGLFVSLLIPILVIIAYATLLERKLMGSIQRRKGPNVVGLYGLLQPLADGLKLLGKEFFWPRKSYVGIYIFSASLGFYISLLLWLFLPLTDIPFLSVPFVILCIIAIQIVETYSLILAGWSSNSKYALLGALRTTAQMISYELALSFIILTIIILGGSVDIVDLVGFQMIAGWFIISLLPLGGVFLCASLAETNRTPFDLPEAEAELVAGYNVEYAGMLFALFFLAEYSNMVLLSTLLSLFFLGGWDCGCLVDSPGLQSGVLGVKAISILFVFIWVRATLPRYRYDQLMDLGWKVFLPLTFGGFLLLLFGVYITGALPIADTIVGF